MHSSLRLSVLLLIVVSIASPLFGQAGEAPGLIVVTEIKLKPTHVGQFEGVLKKLGEAHRKLSTGVSFNVAQSRSGDIFSFVIVATHDSWAAMDEITKMGPPPAILVRAFGEEEGGQIAAQAVESFISVSTHFLTPRPDLTLQR